MLSELITIGAMIGGCTMYLAIGQIRIIQRLDRLIEIASDHPPQHEPAQRTTRKELQ